MGSGQHWNISIIAELILCCPESYMSHVNVHSDIVIVSVRVVRSLFSTEMGFNSAGTIGYG